MRVKLVVVKLEDVRVGATIGDVIATKSTGAVGVDSP